VEKAPFRNGRGFFVGGIAKRLTTVFNGNGEYIFKRHPEEAQGADVGIQLLCSSSLSMFSGLAFKKRDLDVPHVSPSGFLLCLQGHKVL
jgi:hypothetical protein